MIAWKRALRRRPDEATLVFDGDHWIAALLSLWHVGRLLVLNIHLHPKIPYREWLQQVHRMEQLRRDLQNSYTYLAGDLNATDPTNHITVKGIRRTTAIDHAFIHSPVAEARHQLLSSCSSHAVIVITVTLLTKYADVWAWRRFRWRRASPSDMDAMGAALDVACPHPGTTGRLRRLASRGDGIAYSPPPGHASAHAPPCPAPFPSGARPVGPATSGSPGGCRGARHAEAPRRPPRCLHHISHALSPAPPPAPWSRSAASSPAKRPSSSPETPAWTKSSVSPPGKRAIDFCTSATSSLCPLIVGPVARSSLELPTVQLLALLRAGLPPDHPDTPQTFLQNLNSRPLLTPDSLAHRRLGKCTLAVSSDKITRSLLFWAGGGVQHGLHQSLLQAEAGTPTVLNETGRYGICKGKPSKPLPRHLARSFPQVDVESAASGTLSGIASDRLAANREVLGAYTPVAFSYRPGLSSAFMVLVGRAAIYASLLEHGSCAICDWDQSDAYLRVVREFTQRLLHCLLHVWDCSQWAHNFYIRLVIRVITCEGFAPPFSTGKGGNQGYAFAALDYQAPSHVLTLSLAINWYVALPLRLPSHNVPLPATTLVSSDDRRFLAPTLPEVVAMADASRDASRRAGRIVHPDKLEYFLARLGHHGITLERSPVPDSEMYTNTTPPELVGIPLLLELPLHRAANKALTALCNVHKSTARGPAAPVICLRSLHSFGLSVLDYVASGVLFPPESLRPHQRMTDSVYSAAFRLPAWVHRSLLRLPLASGGFGSPGVTLRSHLHLLTSYLRASWSTNLLAVPASHLHLSLPPPGWLAP